MVERSASQDLQDLQDPQDLQDLQESFRATSRHKASMNSASLHKKASQHVGDLLAGLSHEFPDLQFPDLQFPDLHASGAKHQLLGPTNIRTGLRGVGALHDPSLPTASKTFTRELKKVRFGVTKP